MDLTQLIAALGGTKATATLFGVGSSAVSNWKKAGCLPARLHLRALRECEGRGIAFDPSPPIAPKRKRAA